MTSVAGGPGPRRPSAGTARFGVAFAVALTGSAWAKDADAPVRIETGVERTTCFVGEAVPVRLRVSCDADFLQRHGVPIHRRPMDLPVHVAAPWLDRLAGARVERADRAPGTTTFAVNDEVLAAAAAPAEPDGRAVYELVRRIVPSAPGEIVLAAPTVRFAWAPRFEEDVIQGRTPVDRRDVVVTGAATTLRVAPLPDAGRPGDFTGAVGRFAATAVTDAREARVGEAVRITLRIEGDGDVGAFAPPRLDAATGLHVLGVLDHRDAGARTFVLDLSVLRADVTEIPPIALSYFDPEPPGAYRVTATAALPLRVHPSAHAPAAPPPSTPEPDARVSPLAIAAIVAAVLGGLVVALRRAKSRTSDDPVRARIRTAAEAALRRLAARDADADAILAEYLAARLDCAPAAVISTDLSARLERSGVPSATAARAARLVESLVAARYGGALPGSAAEETRALVEELERIPLR